MVGAGYIPFATEEEEAAAAKAHLSAEEDKPFNEMQDDRHVLLGAIGGPADLLATADITDFNRASAIAPTNRDDILLFPRHPEAPLVGKPAFIAY